MAVARNDDFHYQNVGSSFTLLLHSVCIVAAVTLPAYRLFIDLIRYQREYPYISVSFAYIINASYYMPVQCFPYCDVSGGTSLRARDKSTVWIWKTESSRH